MLYKEKSINLNNEQKANLANCGEISFYHENWMYIYIYIHTQIYIYMCVCVYVYN